MDIMTSLQLQDAHTSTLDSVYTEQYYVSVMDDLLLSHGMSIEAAYKMTNANQICSFWHEFWNMLPDVPAIQRKPFYAVCDLAEGSYLYD